MTGKTVLIIRRRGGGPFDRLFRSNEWVTRARIVEPTASPVEWPRPGKRHNYLIERRHPLCNGVPARHGAFTNDTGNGHPPGLRCVDMTTYGRFISKRAGAAWDIPGPGCLAADWKASHPGRTGH